MKLTQLSLSVISLTLSLALSVGVAEANTQNDNKVIKQQTKQVKKYLDDLQNNQKVMNQIVRDNVKMEGSTCTLKINQKTFDRLNRMKQRNTELCTALSNLGDPIDRYQSCNASVLQTAVKDDCQSVYQSKTDALYNHDVPGIGQ